MENIKQYHDFAKYASTIITLYIARKIISQPVDE